MNRISFLIIFFFSLNCLMRVTVQAQSSIGLNIGVNNTKLTGDQPTAGWFGLDKGYVYGVSYRYRPKQAFSISTNANYTKATGKYVYADTTEIGKDSLSLEMTSIIIPLNFEVWSESGRFYVSTGLELFLPLTFKGYQAQGEIDYRNEVRDFTLFAQFSVGMIIPVGKPHFFVEARYSQGLIDLIGPVHDSRESNFPRTKAFSVRLAAGINIPFGNAEIYTIKKRKYAGKQD